MSTSALVRQELEQRVGKENVFTIKQHRWLNADEARKSFRSLLVQNGKFYGSHGWHWTLRLEFVREWFSPVAELLRVRREQVNAWLSEGHRPVEVEDMAASIPWWTLNPVLEGSQFIGTNITRAFLDSHLRSVLRVFAEHPDATPDELWSLWTNQLALQVHPADRDRFLRLIGLGYQKDAFNEARWAEVRGETPFDVLAKAFPARREFLLIANQPTASSKDQQEILTAFRGMHDRIQLWKPGDGRFAIEQALFDLTVAHIVLWAAHDSKVFDGYCQWKADPGSDEAWQHFGIFRKQYFESPGARYQTLYPRYPDEAVDIAVELSAISRANNIRRAEVISVMIPVIDRVFWKSDGTRRTAAETASLTDLVAFTRGSDRPETKQIIVMEVNPGADVEWRHRRIVELLNQGVIRPNEVPEEYGQIPKGIDQQNSEPGSSATNRVWFDASKLLAAGLLSAFFTPWAVLAMILPARKIIDGYVTNRGKGLGIWPSFFAPTYTESDFRQAPERIPGSIRPEEGFHSAMRRLAEQANRQGYTLLARAVLLIGTRSPSEIIIRTMEEPLFLASLIARSKGWESFGRMSPFYIRSISHSLRTRRNVGTAA